MPFKQVRLTTLVTPDIADPDPGRSRSSFWVEVKTGPAEKDRARFAFHGVGTDVDGNETDFTVPMMFVSLSAQGDVLDAVHDKYNKAAAGQLEERELRIPGQQLAFAKPDADPAKRNSVLVTESLNFVLDENGDPKLLKAACGFRRSRSFSTSAATTIRLFQEYEERLRRRDRRVRRDRQAEAPDDDSDRARRYGRRHARRRVQLRQGRRLRHPEPRGLDPHALARPARG